MHLEVQDSNKGAIKRTKEISTNYQFNICHLRISESELEEDQLEKTCSSVDKHVKKIWDISTPLSMICVVFGGQVDRAPGACFLSVKKTMNDVASETVNSNSESLNC